MRKASTLVGGGAFPAGISGTQGQVAKFNQAGDLNVSSALTSSSHELAYSANVELPLAQANAFKLQLTGDTVISVPTETFEGDWKLVIEQDSVGYHSVTFDPSIKIISDAIQPYPNSRTLVQMVGIDGEYHLTTVSIAPRT